MPEHLQSAQDTQEAAGRAGAAARLSARQRGRAVPRISGSTPDRPSQGRRYCRFLRSGPGAAARAGSLPDQEQAQAMPERLLKFVNVGNFEHFQCLAALE